MLGDMAVAVHPDDERYKKLVGEYVVLPLMLPFGKRNIPIIADNYSDPEKGSGAVKITPAHDFNDIEVWKRYLAIMSDDAKESFSERNNYNPPDELINIFTPEAKLKSSHTDDLDFSKRADWPMPDHIRRAITEDAQHNSTDMGFSNAEFIPEDLRGLGRVEARKRIVALLEANGYLEKVEPHKNVVPHGDRSNEVIEPFLTEQWYVDAKTLAQPAIAAVRESKTKFTPKNWEKTYFDWMENIQPWCISRQLWWGHQIPAWYGPDGHVFAALSEAEATKDAAEYYESKGAKFETGFMPLDGIDYAARLRDGRNCLKRDEDVLDTWFSSALWPFSTLGWPDETKELKRFYPTSALVTGFDIVFFWVARMMMMGLHFQKEVPFKDVYIHRLVRDATGAKMSKSKGNVVDPLGVIDEFGADALRFTLLRAVAPGHDIRLGPQDVENNRNFATKLWNAARFVEFNGAARVEGFDPKSAKETLNRWIAHETAKATAEITQAIEAYAFNEAAGAAYRFVWNVYCDWYVELSKPLLTGPDGAAKDETRAMAAWALDEILKLLHPFMPFITEELWAVTAERGPKRSDLLALSEWPKLDTLEDADAGMEIGSLIKLIETLRAARNDYDLPPINLSLVRARNLSAPDKFVINKYKPVIERLGRSIIDVVHPDLIIPSAEGIPPEAVAHLKDDLLRGHAIIPFNEGELLLQGIDIAQQREKYKKQLLKIATEIEHFDKKLNNPNFIARAPEEVVEEEKEKREEALGRKEKIAEALERLKGAT
jgi:valyl-tRNA synthetase